MQGRSTQKLVQCQISLAALFEQLPLAILLVDQDRTILEQNSLASQLLKTSTKFASQQGILSLTDDEENQLFQQQVNAYFTQENNADLISKASQNLFKENGYSIEAINFLHTQSRQKKTSSACVIVLSDEHAKLSSCFPRLQQKFNLTEKECEILSALTEGQSIKQIANNCYNSVHTVRTHVKSLMAKTGTQRQIELIQLASDCAKCYLARDCQIRKE